MTRKLILILFLGVFFIGCKSKKRVTYGKSKTVTTPSKERKPANNSSRNKDLYPMPEDTGEFKHFTFATIQEYIATFSEVAQLEMRAFGIPASITLAQGLLESGFGKGELAKKTNNHFGIKCHAGWTGDYDFHDDDEKGECFRKYNHPMYSYRDHSLFLTERSRYAFLFEFSNTNYKKWAYGLKKAGYATDKKYPNKLISIIEKYDLYNYDLHGEIPTYKEITKVHVVQKGETLYAISKTYSVEIADLKRINYLNDNILSVGQKLKIPTQKIN